jgi:hypothetical protein
LKKELGKLLAALGKNKALPLMNTDEKNQNLLTTKDTKEHGGEPKPDR